MLSLRKRHRKEPTLSDLSYFIEKESALADDPLFPNSAVDEYLEKPVKPARRSLKMNLKGAKENENQKKMSSVSEES